MTDTNAENKGVATSPNVDSELIPAEAQLNTQKTSSISVNEPLQRGYTVDETGVFNNYAVEPKMSESKYPSRQQQQRYIIQGAGAALFIGVVLWLAFAVS